MASNIVYGVRDEQMEGSNHTIERQIEQIQSIKSFVTRNPAVKRHDSEIIVLDVEIDLGLVALNSVRSEDIKMNSHQKILHDFLYMEANGACMWHWNEDIRDVAQESADSSSSELGQQEDAMPAQMQHIEEQKIEVEEEKKDQSLDTISDEIMNLRS